MNRLICYMKKNRSGMAVAGYFLLAAFLLLMLAPDHPFSIYVMTGMTPIVILPWEKP